MTFGSVCSGIERRHPPPLGWEAGGWRRSAFPVRRARSPHFPTVSNLGDIEAEDFVARARSIGPVDLIIGGTPCQSFSGARLRGGIEDILRRAEKRGKALPLQLKAALDRCCNHKANEPNLVTAVRTNPYRGHDSDEGELIVAHALSAEGHDPSEHGTGYDLHPGHLPHNTPAADGPRYRPPWATAWRPVVRWIGERIEPVEQVLSMSRLAIFRKSRGKLSYPKGNGWNATATV